MYKAKVDGAKGRSRSKNRRTEGVTELSKEGAPVYMIEKGELKNGVNETWLCMGEDDARCECAAAEA